MIAELELTEAAAVGDVPRVVVLAAALAGWTTFAGTVIAGVAIGAGGRTAGWRATVPVVTSAVTPAAPVPAGRSRGMSPSGAPARGASQAVKPTVRQSRPIEMLRKARTRVGSRWVPEERTSSRRAAATPIGRL